VLLCLPAVKPQRNPLIMCNQMQDMLRTARPSVCVTINTSTATTSWQST
jgi:hypothetical protein